MDKNLKADLNFNFDEIGLKFSNETMDLLKGLLKKMPKARLAASEALNHPAFAIIDNKQIDEDEQTSETSSMQNNLKQFHEK